MVNPFGCRQGCMWLLFARTPGLGLAAPLMGRNQCPCTRKHVLGAQMCSKQLDKKCDIIPTLPSPGIKRKVVFLYPIVHRWEHNCNIKRLGSRKIEHGLG